MWPYDYFNQYSALINEFNIERKQDSGKTRKVFISLEYYENKKEDEERKQFFEGIIRKVNENITLCDRTSDSYNSFLEYRFETVMPVKAAKDDINTKILVNIMESYIIICDITPKKPKKGKLVFNANVMAELGLALGWKTPEQVIILWDISKLNMKDSMLPFNIKGYFINKVNFKTEERRMIKIIESRQQDIEFKKSIIVRNIKSKLDRNSLKTLEESQGLTFVVLPEEGVNSKEHTIRHLMGMGLIKTEIFPLSGSESKRTYAYQLTELARVVLRELGSREIFDQRFADFMHIYHWAGHKKYHEKEYESKLKDFSKDYKITWSECDSILKNLLKAEKAHFQKDGNMWPAFNCFRNGKTFEVVKKDLVVPWGEQVEKYIKDSEAKKSCD